ncbi:MAG TPA: hypothetical protein VF331_23730 [Polyangiales bacterium]
MRRSAALASLASLVALTSFPARPAAAGGLEYAGAGATALARGGAVTARADDPMVLSYNPAGLAELRGSQLLIDVNIASMHACVDPIGYYGWGVYGGGQPVRFTEPGTQRQQILNLGVPDKLGRAESAYYNGQLDTVCMQQHLMPVPQLAVTGRLSEKLGIGFGLVFPAATPQGQWGDNNGLVHDSAGNLRPAATRYMLRDAGTLGIFPTFGAGYRLTRWLRVGAAVEWGMVWVDSTTTAALQPGTGPDGDIVAHVKARDLFVPGATFSVHMVPNDRWDLVAAFRYQDSVHAPGSVTLTTGEYYAQALARSTRLDVLDVTQNMPWKLRAGIRYSDRLAPRPTGTGGGELSMGKTLHDPMQDERWDAELDLEYQINSRNQAQTVEYRQHQTLAFVNHTGAVNSVQFPDPTQPATRIDKRWKDQISARLGGSYNVLPGLLALSAGVHYENRGVDPSYMQIDYWPVQRVGLHGGLTIRVAGTTDLVFSYAHMIQETIVVGAPLHEEASDIYTRYVAGGQITTIDKRVGTQLTLAQRPPIKYENGGVSDGPAGDGRAKLVQVVTKTSADHPPWIVSSGSYRSGIDVVAIGVHSHF